ncbi:MAG: cytochrome b N-terminal domain-containing protein [Chthoniobacter sp.]|uniref:cytochrome b N-terminal domain-containing protein n=1 Tax=Chthoniobacter sp. TaxID=2510640 RepID=UPI0032A42AA0
MKRLFGEAWKWIDDRLGISALIGPTMSHLVPRDAGWWYVFGSATMLALIVQVVTGVALAFSYIPSASQAYETLVFITNDAPFGSFLRGLHYFGASAMILMVGAHMAQTFLFGAYKFPREMNWATGVLLLGFTLLMGFTGQLLRWDQNATWSVVIAAEQAGRVPFIGNWLAQFILGGTTIGGATLSRFFAIHVFIVPALIFSFVALHLMLVLRHGISEPPTAGKPVDPKTYRKEYNELMEKTGHPFWPDGAWRDFVFGTGLIIAIVLLALFVGPPALDKPPDPSVLQADPRPDWYLLWYFAVLALIPPQLEGYVMILAPAVIGILLLIAPILNNRGERAPSRRPWAIAVVLLSVIMIGSLWIAGAKSPWSPNFDPVPLTPEIIGATNGPVFIGAHLFEQKACLNCHLVEGHGGRRGPDLTYIADTLTKDNMVIRIVNGGVNMPAFGATLKPEQIDDLVAFLQTRKRPVRAETAAGER